MRLHKHDELVEVMAKAVYDASFKGDSDEIAAAALDAFLEEVVRLGVGKIVTVYGKNLVLEMEAEK
jgi:hypothetical protein